MLVAGLGLGIALVAVALSVLTGAADDEAGMLSGLNTTGHEIGGSLGVAVLVTIATGALGTAPRPRRSPNGLGDAFLVSGVIAAVAGVVALFVLPSAASFLPKLRARSARRHPLGRPMPTSRPRPRRATPRRGRTPSAASRAILDAAVDALGERPRRQHGRDRSPGAAWCARPSTCTSPPATRCSTPSATARCTRSLPSIEAAEPERGERRRRAGAASWRRRGARSGRYHALVAINTSTHTPRCAPASLGPRPPRTTDARGQADGSFRSDVPASWHLSMLMALIHAASAELQAARVDDGQAEDALVSTVLGAICS